MADIDPEAWLDSTARHHGQRRTAAAVNKEWLDSPKSRRSRTVRQPASEPTSEFLVKGGQLKRTRAG
jgi:hypothetical protein